MQQQQSQEESDARALVQAVSIELGQAFESLYNSNNDSVLDLFQKDASFSVLVRQETGD